MSSPLFNQGYGAYAPLSAANGTVNATEAMGLPVWYFVGRQDSFLGSTRSAVSTLTAAQGGSVPSYPAAGDPDFYFTHGSLRYTEYQIGGHSNTVWNNGAYADANLYDWMLSQQTTFGGLKQGESVGINLAGTSMGTTTDTAGQVWNSIGKYGSQRTEDFALGFGYDQDGSKTTISMAVSKAFDKRETKVPVGITAFDDASVADQYWMTYFNQTAEIMLYGLTPGESYNLDIFASTTDANVVGLYTVGDTSAVLDASDNLDEWAQLSGLIADADGALKLVIAPDDGANRRGHQCPAYHRCA